MSERVCFLLVTPGARKNALGEVFADAQGQQWQRVRIAAPPEDGKANRELLKFLSQCWDVPVKSLVITSGETSRYKKVRIEEG